MTSISVRTLLAIIITVVGVTAAAVAFAPVYVSAITSVKDVAQDLRVEVGSRIQTSVLQFFSQPQAYISSLILGAKLQGMNVSDKLSMIPWLGSVALQSNLPTYSGFEDGSFLYLSVIQAPDMVRVNIKSGANDWKFAYNITEQNTTNIPAPTANTYNPTLRPWYPPLKRRQSWSSVYLDSSGNYSVLTVGGPFINDTGMVFGAFAIDFSTTLLIDFLSNQRVGKTGRVLLVDRTSRGFLAGNWEVSGVVDVGGTLQMATMADIAGSDPLLSSAYSRLGESYLLNCTAPCKTTLEDGADVNAIYVDVLPITDQYGLDMRLIVLLSAEDFLGKVDKDSKVSIGATVGALVGLLVIAVVVGHLALLPLSQLEERLYAAASLADEEETDDGCSFLSEIINIEEAFQALRAELTRVKSFVPQSVLQRLEAGDEWDDEESKGSQPLSATQSLRESSSVPLSPLARRESRPDGARTTKSGQSHTSIVRDKKGAPVLNVSVGLVPRQVTLLTVNILGFHDTLTHSVAACTRLHSDYMNIVTAVVAKNRGVLDTFSGDRVFISFNASNNVATHVTRCAATICAIEEATKKTEGLIVRMAAATGRVLAGNMGNNTIKRFTTVGSTVNQSMVLLQLAKMWNVPNLVSSTAMETMEFEYNMQAVGVAKLPFQGADKIGDGGRTTVVGSVLSAKSSGDNEEWMYELNTGSTLESDLKILKAAFQLCAEQSNWQSAAAGMLEGVQTKSLVGYVRLQNMMKQPEVDLGTFYRSICGFEL